MRTKNLYFILSISCLAYSSFLAEPLLATIFYVDDDGGPGIDFTTIQAAANVVNPGDTVIVKDGIYQAATGANNVVNINRGGSAGGGPVVFRSENPWGAKIDGSGAVNHTFSISTDKSFIRIEGFEIMDATNAGIKLQNRNAKIEIVNNNIHGSLGAAAISVHGQGTARSTDLLVDGNFIHHNGDTFFSTPGQPNYDPNNENKDHGIYMSPLGAVVRNNIFATHEYGWAIQTSAGAEDVSIYNNVFAYPNPARDGHIMLWQENHNISIRNNIFFKPRGHAVQDWSLTGSGIVIEDNLTTSANMTDGSIPASVTLGVNQVSTDPRFMVPATPAIPTDFQLQSSSPAIDLGATLAEVPWDYNQIVRPQNGGHDIGAFEFVGIPEEPFPDNLANALTRMADSENFSTASPIAGLWDDDTSGNTGTTAASSDNSFWVEYDLGQIYDLSQSRFFGDAVGNWVSDEYSVLVKSALNDAYTTVIANAPARGNQWYEAMLNTQARFVKLEVVGDPGKGVQAFEFEVKGTVANVADFNGDGVVDEGDLVLWQSGYGMTGNATKSDGDSDGDKDVDGNDFLAWQRQYGNGSGNSSAAATSVPEPSTLGLAGFLLLILLSREGR